MEAMVFGIMETSDLGQLNKPTEPTLAELKKLAALSGVGGSPLHSLQILFYEGGPFASVLPQSLREQLHLMPVPEALRQLNPELAAVGDRARQSPPPP